MSIKKKKKKPSPRLKPDRKNGFYIYFPNTNIKSESDLLNCKKIILLV